MRSDDEVDCPCAKAVDRGPLLHRRDEARQEPDRDRECPEALLEGREVLRGEHGRGHEHGNLLPVLDRLERRPQRDLGLAVADVAHDEAIHRLDGLHVELDLGRGAQLIGRLLVRE